MLKVCGAGESGSGRAEKKKNIFAFRFGEEKKDVDLCTPKQKEGNLTREKVLSSGTKQGGEWLRSSGQSATKR